MNNDAKKQPPKGVAVDDEDPDYIPMEDSKPASKTVESEEELKRKNKNDIELPLKGSA
jgi:hypothetical protein